jgi:O-antigen/teichoic acid export membrane protein
MASDSVQSGNKSMQPPTKAERDSVAAEEIADGEPMEGEHPAVEKPATPTLGEVSTRGVLWTVAATAGIKLISLFSQIALAWFLVPSDMGLLAFALSITSIAEFVTCGGLVQVMVQRNTPIERDSPQVFWLSLSMHVAASLVAIAMAPFAGRIFGDQRIVPLIVVAATAWPLGSLSAIYLIKLLRDLRFKTLAGLQMANALIRALGSVSLAALGFGAYSLVLPMYLCYITSLVIMRRVSGPLPLGKPRPSTWFALLAPALWLTAQSISNAIQSNGTSFVVGSILQDPVVTGLYFWGFALSGQTIFLVVASLSSVLFPSLAKLNNEPERQYQGFQRALRLLNLVAVPLGLMQAIAAEPIVRLLFDSSWYGATPVVQFLSLGLLTQPMQLMTTSLLLAQGKFRLLTVLSVAQGATIVLSSVVGAVIGTPAAIAVCVAVAMFANGLLSGWVAEKRFKRGWLAVADSNRHVMIPAVVSGALGWMTYMWLCPIMDVWPRPIGPVVCLFATSAVVLIGFVLLALRFARWDTIDLLRRLKLNSLAERLERNAE